MDGVIHLNIPPAKLVADDESGGFTTLLREILRHDPDSIWVGEIRDRRSAETTVGAAVTGHLVFGTLHATNAVTGWDVLAQKISENLRWQLIESLSLVTSQRLVRELCPACSIQRPPTEADIRSFDSYMRYQGTTGLILPPTIGEAAAKEDCSVCKGFGYIGNLPIDEVLIFDRAVKDAAHRLLAGDVRARDQIAESMPQTMLKRGLELLGEGRITLQALKS
jgi:type II secretory ATPase GspE/PulE/Tfp pilus assembly ATPase PilB-like protein